MALLPGAVALPPPSAGATHYSSAAEAFSAIDVLQAEVAGRLQRLAEGLFRAFAQSLLRDLERHRLERVALRAPMKLGLAGPVSSAVADTEEDVLDALRAAQEKLTHALAEALPVLDNPRAVRTLARHMMDLSRHTTLVGLWIDSEESRG
jgi:hypothetical protein